MGTIKKRDVELDLVRGMAIIFVILGHTHYLRNGSEWGGIDYEAQIAINSVTRHYLYYVIKLMGDTIFIFHMPLFFMLSGAVFRMNIDSGKFHTFSSLIRGKSLRVLMPFFVVTLFYDTPLKIISGYWVGKHGLELVKAIFFSEILMSSSTHLWFLLVLFIMFIFVYIMEKTKLPKPVILMITFLLTFVAIRCQISITIIYKFCLFIFWFYLGYVWYPHKDKTTAFFKKSSVITVLFMSVFILTALYTFKGFPNWIFAGLASLSVAFIGICTVYGFAVCLSGTKVLRKIIQFFADNSFGLYLYSDTLNYVILRIVTDIFTISVFASWWGYVLLFFLRTVGVTLVSLLIIKILKKLNIKYLC